MSVEVPCPGCGLKLKVPDDRIGKKARCKKCDTHFRIPGPSTPGGSVGESHALSAIAMPGAPLDDDDVPMALAAEPAPPPPSRPAPAHDISSLPSADPFDFSAPPAAKATPPKAAPAPKAPAKPAVPAANAAPAAPARPAFGAAKAKPPESPPPPPAAKVSPAPPAKKPAPEPMPLDPEEVSDTLAASESETSDDPFAFNLTDDPGPVEPRARGRQRDRNEEDDREDEPRSRRGRDRDREDEDDEDDRPRSRDRKRNRDDDDEPEREGRRYVRTEQKSSMLMISMVLGVAAIGALIAAIIVYSNQRSKEEAEIRRMQEEKDKKEKETKDLEAKDAAIEAANKQALADAKLPKGGKVEPKKTEPIVVPPKKKDPVEPGPSNPPKKAPMDPPGGTAKKNPPEPRPKGDTLGLGPAIPLFQFTPPNAKPTLVHKSNDPPIIIAAAPAKVKRIFPPMDRRNNDAVVVWQSVAGFNGNGERLTADIHSGAAGNPVGRIEFDGDGKDVKCDVAPDGKFFVAVGPDDKITVWDLADKGKRKVLEGYDPYADKPDQKAAGLAAVYFTATPKHILTVSTAGAIDLHDIDAKKIVASAGLAGAPTPNRVVMGKNVAADITRTSIVMAVGGDIYQISTAAPLAAVQQIRLGGEVGRSLGIAVLGVPGRIAYAFETDPAARKERALLVAFPNEKPVTYRWPDAPGDATGAAWAGPGFAVIATEKGAVYVRADDETKKLLPFAFGELANPNASHAGTEDGHWYLIADADPNRSMLVEITTDALNDFYNTLEGKMSTVRLNEKGLSK